MSHAGGWPQAISVLMMQRSRLAVGRGRMPLLFCLGTVTLHCCEVALDYGGDGAPYATVEDYTEKRPLECWVLGGPCARGMGTGPALGAHALATAGTACWPPSLWPCAAGPWCHLSSAQSWVTAWPWPGVFSRCTASSQVALFAWEGHKCPHWLRATFHVLSDLEESNRACSH